MVRRLLAISASAAAVLVATLPVDDMAAAPAAPPNVVVVLTDDQSPESLPHNPPVMPYLQARMNDPADHWVYFRNAFLNTPLCCPSRASILTGQYSHHTGVTDNANARVFRESSTLATWLQPRGYRTAMIGKYLNGYPFGRGPYVPPGWDRWVAKESSQHYYYDYTLVEDGVRVSYGSTAADHSTDVLAGKATDFVRRAPAGQPFFLYFAPIAPHYPMTPPPRHATALADLAPTRRPSFNELDVSDKPAWVRARPPMTAELITEHDRRRLDSYRSLLGVDDAVRSIMTALEEKGVLDNTVVIFLSDNGHAFGEHRWTEKLCAYEECIRTPLLIRYPPTTRRTESRFVTNVDLAPTIVGLTGATATLPTDGQSLVPLLAGTPPSAWRSGVLLYWKGNATDPVTGYWGIRTPNFLYAEHATGERELYDLTGVRGSADPYQLENRAGRPAYAATKSRLAAALAQLRAG
jgi:N-acetylglucosamine-6-sulfatase